MTQAQTDQQAEIDRLRQALDKIGVIAVAKVGEYGNLTPEQRLKAIWDVHYDALFQECYCGGFKNAHQTGCPEADQ